MMLGERTSDEIVVAHSCKEPSTLWQPQKNEDLSSAAPAIKAFRKEADLFEEDQQGDIASFSDDEMDTFDDVSDSTTEGSPQRKMKNLRRRSSSTKKGFSDNVSIIGEEGEFLWETGPSILSTMLELISWQWDMQIRETFCLM